MRNSSSGSGLAHGIKERECSEEEEGKLASVVFTEDSKEQVNINGLNTPVKTQELLTLD